LCHAEGRAGRKQGAILGTLQYLAPGQLEGKSVDARTDIFAFGALVYEMLTGKGAFQAESQAAIDWWNPQGRSAANRRSCTGRAGGTRVVTLEMSVEGSR